MQLLSQKDDTFRPIPEGPTYDAAEEVWVTIGIMMHLLDERIESTRKKEINIEHFIQNEERS